MDRTPQAEDLARCLLEVTTRLHRWAATAVHANRGEHDPSLRQLAVLFALRDGVASPVLIARRLRVNRAVVTGLLDRLEQRGLVRREADPVDRRRQRIVMTPAGVAASAAITQGLINELTAQLDLASAEDLGAAERTMALLARTLTALEETTPVAAGAIGDDDAWGETETTTTNRQSA
ncbi:MAG: MarR family transcriptional regulator [Thermomicrobiales bacterium]